MSHENTNIEVTNASEGTKRPATVSEIRLGWLVLSSAITYVCYQAGLFSAFWL